MDVLAETVSYLSDRLSMRVRTEAPKTIPKRFVIVRRSGGGGSRFIDNPRLTIHCWDESDAKAGSLCRQVADAMLEAPDYIDNMASISQDTIYQNDLDGRHRWTVSLVAICNR